MHNSKSFMGCHKETCERHLNVTGGPFFQVVNLNGNLTQFRPSEIHYLRDPTARNGSLDM